MNKIKMNDTLIFLFIADLIMCGAGRIIMFGPISERYLLFLLMILAYVGMGIQKNSFLINKHQLYILFFLLFLSVGIFIGIINGNSLTNIAISFQGYLYFLLILPLYSMIRSEDIIDKIWKWFDIFCAITSITAILCFIFILVTPTVGYSILAPLFVNYSLGLVDIVNGIPRIFLKVSPILGLFSIRQLNFILFGNYSLKNYIYAVLGLSATIVSLTMGIWIGVLIAVIIMLIPILRKLSVKKFLFILLMSSLVFFLFNKYDFTNILASRFSSTDYSKQQKTSQFLSLITQILQHPIFGNGFGKQIMVISPVGIKEQTQFELSYLQIILNIGIAGLLWFLTILSIPYVVFFKNKKMLESTNYDNLINIQGSLLGFLVVIVASSVNPFVNNPIGIGVFLLILVSIDRISYLNKITGGYL